MTWSIIARDPATGALGVVVASFAPGAGQAVPFVRLGAGVVATQGNVNRSFGPDALQMLEAGATPDATLQAIVARDPMKAERQVHLMDRSGQSAAFTGDNCLGWRGHMRGPNISAAGNSLAGRDVLSGSIEAFEASAGAPFTERLLAALEAGQAAGGDRRGLRSAGLVVASPVPGESVRVDVGDSGSAIEDLRRQMSGSKVRGAGSSVRAVVAALMAREQQSQPAHPAVSAHSHNRGLY